MKNKYNYLKPQLKRVFDYCKSKNYNGYLVSYQDYDNDNCSYFSINRNELKNLKDKLRKDNINNYNGIELISVLDLTKSFENSEIDFELGE